MCQVCGNFSDVVETPGTKIKETQISQRTSLDKMELQLQLLVHEIARFVKSLFTFRFGDLRTASVVPLVTAIALYTVFIVYRILLQ